MSSTIVSTSARGIAAILLGAAFVGSFAAPAAAASTELQVTAYVMKRATLQVLAQPTSVVLTQDDIARGWVDVPATAQLAVQSNSGEGYMLEFTNQGDFVRQVLVKGLDTDVQVGAAGGAVMQRAKGRGVTRATLNLGFRILLSASARQGSYSWPMRVAIAPI
jgi:hypothetical protein